MSMYRIKKLKCFPLVLDDAHPLVLGQRTVVSHLTTFAVGDKTGDITDETNKTFRPTSSHLALLVDPSSKLQYCRSLSDGFDAPESIF